MTNFYILKDKKPVRVDDFREYVMWMENDKNRIIEHTEIGDILVSTVFLGIDHRMSFGPSGPPILFETMVFGGEFDQHQKRYSIYDKAKEGHNEICDMVLLTFAVEKEGLKKLIIDSLN